MRIIAPHYFINDREIIKMKLSRGDSERNLAHSLPGIFSNCLQFPQELNIADDLKVRWPIMGRIIHHVLQNLHKIKGIQSLHRLDQLVLLLKQNLE